MDDELCKMDSKTLNATPAAAPETLVIDFSATELALAPRANTFTIPHRRALSPTGQPPSARAGAAAHSHLPHDEDDDVDLFEEETFMHRGLGASSHPSKNRSHSPDNTANADESGRSGDCQPGDALDTPIASHNPGYQLLLKLGWTAGKGLGATESGRVDPIPHYSHVGTTGLGQWQQDLEYMSLATARPVSLAERLATESDADREKREAKVQRNEATKAEVDAVKRALYRCDICNKQYNKQHEVDSHLGSYEHHHAKRAREMRQAERKLAKEGGEVEKEKRRAKRREEKEMEMMVKAAAASAAAAAIPGGSVGVQPVATVTAAHPPISSVPAAVVVPFPTAAAAPAAPQHFQQQHHYAAQYAAYSAQHHGAQSAGYPQAAAYNTWPQHQQHQLVQQPPPFPQAPPSYVQTPLPHRVLPATSTELFSASQPTPVSTTSAPSAPATSSGPSAGSSSTAPRPVISFGLGRKFKK